MTPKELKMYFAGSAKHGRSGLTLFSHYCKLGVACETMDLHCCKTDVGGINRQQRSSPHMKMLGTPPIKRSCFRRQA